MRFGGAGPQMEHAPPLAASVGQAFGNLNECPPVAALHLKEACEQTDMVACPAF